VNIERTRAQLGSEETTRSFMLYTSPRFLYRDISVCRVTSWFARLVYWHPFHLLCAVHATPLLLTSECWVLITFQGPEGSKLSVLSQPSTTLQAPVHEWNEKDVKAWAKSMNLPKRCYKQLQHINGQVRTLIY
jgi:hypothetical protein